MEYTHHTLEVVLHPTEHSMSGTDTITLPADRPDTILFRLHAGLAPMSQTAGVEIEKIGEEAFIATYRAKLPSGRKRFSVGYGGKIFHELSAPDRTYARGMRHTAGQISQTGVYLDGSAHWYPVLDRDFLTFKLTVELPDGWHAISQGRQAGIGNGEVIWTIDYPQEQIFLIAGQFKQYTQAAGNVSAMVFLRRPDKDLADRYLSVTGGYIDMYADLIGPYPYAKFALVENFWETGFGMPSFTLLGPRVIRFPFIIYSSYPHEILHNWWGNAVYPVNAAGNWAEGLTAYLSDHLIKAQQGKGAEYRQTSLQKYTDYVSTEKDFPLTAFTARHNSAAEAVGYGKSMMFFHMLRRELGDRGFKKALQAFYQRYRFQYADYDDLRKTFESVSGEDLTRQFDQWVHRTGAPRLVVKKANQYEDKGRHVIDLTLSQQHEGAAYTLTIPVAVTLAGEDAAREIALAMNKRKQKFRLAFSERPLRIDVDPQYDVFRKLARTEIPPALSQFFGAETVVAVLPVDASAKQQAEYRAFAESLGRAGPDEIRIIVDREIEKLPTEGSVVLLGWKNRFRDNLTAALDAYDSKIDSSTVKLAGKTLDRYGHAAVIVTRHPADANQVLAWMAADNAAALPGLARKLPHYHKYSYLAFTGEAPDNIAKGRWPVLDSPMTVFFEEQKADMGKLAERAPLAQLPPDLFDKLRLK